MNQRYVIIGAGIAGMSAAVKIRDLVPSAEIVLISEEEYYPYYRIKLSKTLLSSIKEEDYLIKEKKWYAEKNIKIYKGYQVKSIDFANQIVKFKNCEISYNKILIATGGKEKKPKIEGINKDNIYGLRTIKDKHSISKASRDAHNILIIGGGIQGLEVAYEFVKQGKKVIVLEIANRLLPRQLDEETSQNFKELVKSNGVKICLNTEIKAIKGKSKIESIITAAGEEYPIDLAVYSIGISPNIELCRGSDININKGIIVNKYMETNIKNVYAAGDVCEYKGNLFGMWNIAKEQGEIAGENMVGNKVEFKDYEYPTLLSAFNTKLCSIGSLNDMIAYNTIKSGKIENNDYKNLIYDNDRLVGAILIGNIKDMNLLKSKINELKFPIYN
ncbi:nitrite reductase (NADH) large subunit [Natranaerovirga pectinivora]|uniref:Nitrite reductase (NADH) large subunit n=1 Tax=Natranaerovirga pectinivora TaxID=682400 RepID=A0A4R3MPL2_9FIRM|nr:FAD-dependent oxidoreductase [Natranaerovirga pectinivora]TCT16714.1 nitrite reductase (NADH) large subunit [Natranaerovirga pectinivora]